MLPFYFVFVPSAPARSCTLISYKKLSELQGKQESNGSFGGDRKPTDALVESNAEPRKGGLVLPFQPLVVAFRNVQYYRFIQTRHVNSTDGSQWSRENNFNGCSVWKENWWYYRRGD